MLLLFTLLLLLILLFFISRRGDESNNLVQLANLIAENVTVLQVVAYHRLVNQVTEQPKGSYYPSYDTVNWFWNLVSWERILTHMIWFGHWAPKPTWLQGFLPGMQCISRVYSKKRWKAYTQALKEAIRTKYTSFRKKTALSFWKARHPKQLMVKVQGKWTSGTKDTNKAAAFTWLFAKNVIETYRSARHEQLAGNGTYTRVAPLDCILANIPFRSKPDKPVAPAVSRRITRKTQSNLITQYFSAPGNAVSNPFVRFAGPTDAAKTEPTNSAKRFLDLLRQR